jgi:hypothetical protein
MAVRPNGMELVHIKKRKNKKKGEIVKRSLAIGTRCGAVIAKNTF